MKNLQKFLSKKENCGHAVYKVVRFELLLPNLILNEQIATKDLYSFNKSFRNDFDKTLELAKKEIELKTEKSILKSKEVLQAELKNSAIILIKEASEYSIKYRQLASTTETEATIQQNEIEIEGSKERIKKLKKENDDAKKAYKKYIWSEYGL